MLPRPRMMAAGMKALVPVVDEIPKRTKPNILRTTPRMAVNLGPR